MSDTLSTITHLIQSPPGQLAAGGVLAGIVWKFFERVEAVLTDQTKLEIAVWLLGVKVGQKVEPWPETFARVFDRVFGEKHLSWKCFWRSMIASIITGVVTGPYMWHFVNHTTIFEAYRKMIITGYYGAELAMIYLGLNVIPDYITLFETRLILRVIRCSHASLWLLLMLCDIDRKSTRLNSSHLGISYAVFC